jgi:hypothetical protein
MIQNVIEGYATYSLFLYSFMLLVPFRWRVLLESPQTSRCHYCERSVGTVFQLPNPDAINSRDEGKERRWLPSLIVRVRAQSTCC